MVNSRCSTIVPVVLFLICGLFQVVEMLTKEEINSRVKD